MARHTFISRSPHKRIILTATDIERNPPILSNSKQPIAVAGKHPGITLHLLNLCSVHFSIEELKRFMKNADAYCKMVLYADMHRSKQDTKVVRISLPSTRIPAVSSSTSWAHRGGAFRK